MENKLYGILSIFTSLILQIKKNWIKIVSMIFILLVAMSRLYLGVHTPTDVIGGTIIGIVFLSNKLFELAEKGKKTLFLISITLILVLGFILSLRLNQNNHIENIVGTFLIAKYIDNKIVSLNKNKAEYILNNHVI